MSAVEIRELTRQQIAVELHGENGDGGVVRTILVGACKDYAVYRDMCGYVRGLNMALQLMDRSFAQMHNIPTEEQRATVAENNEPQP